MKNKGVRVFFSLVVSLTCLMICINLNLGMEDSINTDENANIIGYVDNVNYLVVKENINVEINTKLPTIKDYFENYDLNDIGEVKYYLDDKEINDEDVIKNTNEYNVIIFINDKQYKSILNVVDTISPELDVKNITINEGEKYSVNSFVNECKDNSNKDCNISFKDEKMSKYNKPGTYVLSIIAEDKNNNVTIKDAKITIKAKVTSNKTSNNKSNKTSNKSSESSNKVVEQVSSKYKTTNDLKPQAKEEVSKNGKIANEIINYTNTYRKEVGAKELKYDENLSIAATIRAIEIAIYDKFDHVRPNGTSYSSVLKELGINVRYSGENIAYGYLDSEEVSVAWKESLGHYKNMVNTNYTKIGIGYFEYNNTTYWVQTFTS